MTHIWNSNQLNPTSIESSNGCNIDGATAAAMLPSTKTVSVSAAREPLQTLSSLRNKSLLDQTLLSGKLPPSERDTKPSKSHSSRKVIVQQVVHQDSDGTGKIDAFECLKEDSSFDTSSDKEEDGDDQEESDVFDHLESSFESSYFDSTNTLEKGIEGDPPDDNDEDGNSSDSEDSMSSMKVSLHVDSISAVSGPIIGLDTSIITREKLLSIDRPTSNPNPDTEGASIHADAVITTRERKDKRLRDDFVKSGTHFRSLLQGAIDKVAKANHITDSAKKRRLMNDSAMTHGEALPQQDNFMDRETRSHSPSRHDSGKNGIAKTHKNHALTALAQEQQMEILQLRQQLSMSESKANALVHANDTLRSASNQQQSNIQMLESALKISGQKATMAQADADTAKVKADGLELEMKGLEEKMKEFSNVCANVKMEHEEMENAVKEMESKVWFMEKELERSVLEKEEVEKEQRTLNHKVEEMNGKIISLEEELQCKQKELEVVHTTMAEKEDIHRSRENRARQLEREVRDARFTLVELTSAAADAQSVVTHLQETIGNLQSENARLHSVIQDSSESAAKERVKFQEALSHGEVEKQKLRVTITNHEERLEQMKLDKSSVDREMDRLKIRISSLEKSLNDTTSNLLTAEKVDENREATEKNESIGINERRDASAITSLSSETIASDLTTNTPGESVSSRNSRMTVNSNSSELAMASSVASEFSYKTPNKFSIPSLKSSQSRLGGNIEKLGYMPTGLTEPFNRILPKIGATSVDRSSNKICAICSKNAYGVMKACQCGDPTCEKRAHANCLPKNTPISSVSHPGSTIPLPPTIFCQRNFH